MDNMNRFIRSMKYTGIFMKISVKENSMVTVIDLEICVVQSQILEPFKVRVSFRIVGLVKMIADL